MHPEQQVPSTTDTYYCKRKLEKFLFDIYYYYYVLQTIIGGKFFLRSKNTLYSVIRIFTSNGLKHQNLMDGFVFSYYTRVLLIFASDLRGPK